jgi:hypothetical protein
VEIKDQNNYLKNAENHFLFSEKLFMYEVAGITQAAIGYYGLYFICISIHY